MVAIVMLLACALAPPALSVAEAKPALMLANVHHPGVRLQNYSVGEKYDGVRGFWDGDKLLTRGGEKIAAPAKFTTGWPSVALDGEV